MLFGECAVTGQIWFIGNVITALVGVSIHARGKCWHNPNNTTVYLVCPD